MSNFPIKMFYKECETMNPKEVEVYDFHYTQDVEGNLINTFITAWVPVNKTWITAPIWCFQPFEKRKLTEEK